MPPPGNLLSQDRGVFDAVIRNAVRQILWSSLELNMIRRLLLAGIVVVGEVCDLGGKDFGVVSARVGPAFQHLYPLYFILFLPGVGDKLYRVRI